MQSFASLFSFLKSQQWPLLLGQLFAQLSDRMMSIGCGLSFLAIQYAPNLPVTVLLLVALGLFVGLANILTLNLFQSFPEPRQVPQLMSLVNLISSAAAPLSLLIAGLLQSHFSIHIIGEFCGVILVVVCLASWLPFRRWGREYF